MKRNADGTSQKVDVLLHRMETIGSAERSCDVDEQPNSFYAIEDGKDCQKMFDLLGKEEVKKKIRKLFILKIL